MTYRVELKPAAHRQYRKLPLSVQERIVGALERLGQNPRPPGAQKLEAEENLYRVRVRAYRVVYTIEDRKLLVLVVRIAHRRDVYRG